MWKDKNEEEEAEKILGKFFDWLVNDDLTKEQEEKLIDKEISYTGDGDVFINSLFEVWAEEVDGKEEDE